MTTYLGEIRSCAMLDSEESSSMFKTCSTARVSGCLVHVTLGIVRPGFGRTVANTEFSHFEALKTL